MSHAKLSPSGAPAWARCPGKPAAEAPYPDETSAFALEGTCAHALAEKCLIEGISAKSELGKTYRFDEGNWVVDEDMAHYVQTYVDEVMAINQTSSFWQVEVRVPIDHITGEPGAKGTTDFAALEFADGLAILRVHDLKYGKGVKVEAYQNYQALMYALGTFREFEHLLDGVEHCVVEIYIHQPRLSHLPDWSLSLDELKEWGEFLTNAAKKASAPGAPRIPGEKQCRFCKHKHVCPELLALVEENTANTVESKPESLARVLPNLKMIRDWCASVEAKSIEMLETGHEIPGWKLVEGRRTRRWSADESTVVAALEKAGIGIDDLYEKKLISVATACKKLGKSKEKDVESIVEWGSGKPTIASEDDRRPAINPAESLGFSNLT